MINGVNVQVLAILKAAKKSLTAQQYNTLRGQVLAGDSDGAVKGLNKILRTKNNRKFKK